MRPRTLIFVGLGVGATAYIVLSGRANKVANWGRKQRVTGGGKYVLGKRCFCSRQLCQISPLASARALSIKALSGSLC